MKKSTLTAGIAVIGSFLTLTAANLKLKQEYTAGNIRKALVEKKLPPFHFIKETLDRHIYYRSGFTVTSGTGQTPGISVYLSDQGRLLFEVANDTLYIKNNPADKNMEGLYLPIYITTAQLKNIVATSGNFTISQENTDSFSIRAGGVSKISLILTKLNKLTIYGSDNARVSVSASDTINQAIVQMKDRSNFQAYDLLIRQKKLQLGAETSIQLSGRSLADFGVRTEQ